MIIVKHRYIFFALTGLITLLALASLAFYGLRLVACADGDMQVTKASSFEVRQQDWLTPGNHNFLRITRILKSVGLLGLCEHRRAFFECLNVIYKENKAVIGEETFEFWQSAVR